MGSSRTRSTLQQSFIQWGWAALLFILTLLFLRPVLIPQGAQAIARDASYLFVPWLSFARESLAAGRFPLWDPTTFSGYPLYANPQVALFYPFTWLAILLRPGVGLSLYAALHVWLAGVGMYLLVRRSSPAPHEAWLPSLLAALTFMFSGFVAARLSEGHLGLLATLAWTPWIVLALEWSVERRSAWAGVLAGIPLALSILAGHTSSLLFVALIWLAYGLFVAITQRSWGLVIRQGALAGVTALAISAIQTLPTLQLIAHSTRTTGIDYGFASLPPAHLVTLIVPGYFGDSTATGYWSVPNFAELTYYAGVLPLVVLVLALRRPTSRTWLYLALIVFGVLFALGTYSFLYPLLYDLLPPFRLGRAPARALFLYAFAAGPLIAEAVRTWQSTEDASRAEYVRPALRWVVLGGGLALIAALAATGAVFAALHPSDTSGRLWHQVGGWVIALFVLLAGTAALRAVLIGSRARLASILLVGVVIADLWGFGFRLFTLEDAAPGNLWTTARAELGDQMTRVLPWGVPVWDQNDATLAGLRSIFGYNTLELAAYNRLAANPNPLSKAYDVLGAGYVVAPFVLSEGDSDQLTLIWSGEGGALYQRPHPLPLARLVNAYEVIPDPAAALAHLGSAEFDPAASAILDREPGCAPSGDAPGRVQIIETRPGAWHIETEYPAPSLLVLAETAYPGWRAAVDGQPVDILTAYTALQAVCVPAGSHAVTWEFGAPLLGMGAAISAGGLTLCLGAAVLLRRTATI